MWTVGLAIISDVTPPDKLGFVMAFPTMASFLAMVLGPVIGGIVYEKAGYYQVFVVCFAILFFDIALRIVMIERDRHDDSAQCLIEPESSNVEDVNRPHSCQEKIKKIGGKFIPGSFILLKSARFLNALLQTIIIGWLLSSLDATLALHLNKIFGFGSLKSGLSFLAVGGAAIFEPLVGMISDKLGPRYCVVAGHLVMCPSFFLLRIPTNDSVGHLALFMVLLVLIGFGISTLQSPVMAEIQVTTIVEQKNPGKLDKGKGFGQAYAFFNIAFSLGALIGPFEAGPIRTSKGWGVETLSLGIICAIMLIPSILITGGYLFASKHEREMADERKAVSEEDPLACKPLGQKIAEQ